MMKQLLTCAVLALMAVSCNDTAKSADENLATDTSSTAEVAAVELKYPYSLREPYEDWQIGDMNHVVTVLNGLKAYETGDIPACMASFGDSIDVRFDGFHQKFSKDSLQKFFTKSRGELSAHFIEMQDWESVISKDKSKEYVTIWYKEIMTDKKGKKDSLSVVDDARIVNGKIVMLDQKIQRFPAKK